MLFAFTSGFFTGASLIIAIGAQNAFILRQGLLREHVFVLCFICALSDALLITFGVAGFGVLVSSTPLLLNIAKWGGAMFLIGYACVALKRALNPQALEAAKTGRTALSKAIVTCLALTFLNPHVYLDTVVLLGAISANFENSNRLVFGIGAVIASFVWFFGLGYGAQFVRPLFAKPMAWRVLDMGIAAIMMAIALSLILA